MNQRVKIGHYVLGKSIGSGGFAKVREGLHELTGVKVAVKIINKSRMKNKNMISKVKRQIKILKFLSHPHIIKLYQVLDTSSDIYIIMELAQEGQLYEYMQNNDIEEDKAQKIFMQILEGVQCAHMHLVAHRDLKPENILLDAKMNCKIADFGLSNLMKDGKLLKTSCGSLNYAAPQIIGHWSYEGTAVDVWSCGIILYTLVACALPFDQEVTSILCKKIQKADFDIPEFVSPLAQDLLRRMIRVNPQDRMKIKDIKNHPWLRRTVLLYQKVSTIGIIPCNKKYEFDNQIIKKVRNYKMESLNIIDDDRDTMKRMIKGRMDYSFVTAYQLLKDEKDKRQNIGVENVLRHLIIKPVKNRIKDEYSTIEGSPVFGRIYHKSAMTILQCLIVIFKQLKIDFALKNNQYCVMCTKNCQLKRLQINFFIQLYCKRQTSIQKQEEVLVDLRLVKGHPISFIHLSSQLYCLLSHHLKQ